jgi:hypothetical protein
VSGVAGLECLLDTTIHNHTQVLVSLEFFHLFSFKDWVQAAGEVVLGMSWAAT